MYLISRDGISDEERKKLIQSARLSPEETEALANLSFLGCRLTPGPTSKPVPTPRRTYIGSTLRAKMGTKKKGQEEEDRPYDLSRYVPTLKYIMEDEARGSLDTDKFPFTKELPPDAPGGPQWNKGVSVGGGRSVKLASADPDHHKVVSLRTTKPTWAKKTPELLAQMQAQAMDTDPLRKAQGDAEEDLRRNGGRVVVFVLGGMTFSELRSAYEVMKKDRRDVVLGGLISMLSGLLHWI
jgi:syntaxin-binding protein 1